jgi:deazaflavin-dependent oxidoreductase (nitroreductase family)
MRLGRDSISAKMPPCESAPSTVPTRSIEWCVRSPPRRRGGYSSAPTAHHLDQLVSKLTDGKRSFAGIAADLPSVIVTTIGAKSGGPRTVVLLGIPHPDGVAVVAANYGGAKHPAWYHNLKANPAATVTIDGATWNATARIATPRERARFGPTASRSTP